MLRVSKTERLNDSAMPIPEATRTLLYKGICWISQSDSLGRVWVDDVRLSGVDFIVLSRSTKPVPLTSTNTGNIWTMTLRVVSLDSG